MSKSKFNPKHRSRARAVAMQALFQWLHNPGGVSELIEQHLAEQNIGSANNIDAEFCELLIAGCIDQTDVIDGLYNPFLDRPVAQLTAVELVILRLATFELANIPATPYKVVINEAVNLAKEYGAEGSFTFINAVLDKLARAIRSDEIRR